MIYEIRTYDLKPGSQPEVEKRFGEAYEHRRKHSELAAFWHTEIGPLSQIIHVWPYKDLEERARVRAAALKDKTWPPPIGEFMAAQRSDILIPARFSPEIKPGKVGPFFEMRIYTYAAGALPSLLEGWEKALPARLAMGPLFLCGHTELGGLNKWIHIWPYTSLNQRSELRDQAREARVWPPSVATACEGLKGATLVSQENKIVMPAKFSPVQ